MPISFLRKSSSFVAGWVAALSLSALCAQEHISYTYPQLVQKIYDMEALAQPPAAGERAAAATSYDRTSRYDADADRYTDWGSNDDGRGFIRKEGEAQVLADIAGPGVLWRLWSALPEQGKIQIYIDGGLVIDTPFKSLFDNSKGPFAYSALNRVMARGYNLFVPIAFQQSCKIVGQPGWGRYFHCTYTQFPQGARVPSFTGAFSEEDRAALAKAQDIIARRDVLPRDADALQKTLTVTPGQTMTICDLKGPAAITFLRIKTPLVKDKNAERALRELTLSMFWDGEKQPSVWAPLSDFFGSGYGANFYASLPAGLTDDGFYARWYMPFAARGLVQVTNDGDQPRALEVEIVSRPLPQGADKLLRFHAKWHRNAFGHKQPGRYFADRWPDWPLLLVDNAQGRFCGVAIHVWNPFPNSREFKKRYLPQAPRTTQPINEGVLNALMKNWWWGEGDEKFFVDGEKFPSTFGTGTEDYIGYAWCDATVFDSHTQNQSRVSKNLGHIVLSRWHMADNIPFCKSFEGVIEKYHDDNWPLLYAATAFWYQAPETADIYPPQPLGERVDYFAQPQVNPAWLEADGKDHRYARETMGMTLVEAEKLSAVGVSPGLSLQPQSMKAWNDGRHWSAGAQLFARNRERGTSFVLEFPAPDASPKTLYLFPTRAPDYAILRAEVNGQVAVEAFDCFAPQVEAAGSVKLGTFQPKDGKFLIKITAVGANEANDSGHYYLGIDAVGLRPPR